MQLGTVTNYKEQEDVVGSKSRRLFNALHLEEEGPSIPPLFVHPGEVRNGVGADLPRLRLPTTPAPPSLTIPGSVSPAPPAPSSASIASFLPPSSPTPSSPPTPSHVSEYLPVVPEPRTSLLAATTAILGGWGGSRKIPLGRNQKGMRVRITGGAGFLGSHLVDRLIAGGDIVIVMDNFFTGRKENVVHHFGNPRFELIRHDVVEPLLVVVDQIYHQACPASPVHYKFNPVKTIKTNVVGTLNMLGLAKGIGARFLLTSTSEVYGDPLQHPQVET